MRIHEESIQHYLSWIRAGKHFAFAGYSDAEWRCIFGVRDGELTGLGQVISRAHGRKLLEVLRRRQGTKRFLFAVPKCLWPGRNSDGLPDFAEGQIDWFLGREDISIEGWERDMVTDDLAREAGLFPFIQELRQWPLVMIGPKELRRMGEHLPIHQFIEINSPNLHLEPDGIERAVGIAAHVWGRAGIYLVSAGVSAAVIIDRLYDRIPNSWFIDCGSIWDAFVGIGGQREWRAKLYADPTALAQWKKDNLEGKDGRGW